MLNRSLSRRAATAMRIRWTFEMVTADIAQYNFANTLFMLSRYDDATAILETLVETPDSVLRAGCPLEENPRSFKVDAQFLLFLITLYDTGDWDRAFQFAKNHLSLRRRGLQSAWSVAEIRKEIRDLRAEFCGV